MKPKEMMKLSEKIYEGLSVEDMREIETVAFDRSNVFGKNQNRILDLLEGITEDNIHQEIDWGKPVGKEIIE